VTLSLTLMLALAGPWNVGVSDQLTLSDCRDYRQAPSKAGPEPGSAALEALRCQPGRLALIE